MGDDHFDAGESLEDRLLVVATCAWGLRRGEVTSLETNQFYPRTDEDRFDAGADDPQLVFKTRKNGARAGIPAVRS